MNGRTECTLSKLTGDTQLRGVAETPRGLSSHSEGPQQAGEMDREEFHEVQQREMQSPAPREQQLQAPVRAGGQLAGKQLCREGPGDPGEQPADHEPVVHSHDKRSLTASWAALGA